MRRPLAAVLLAGLAAAARPAMSAPSPSEPSAAVRAAVRFSPPEGWIEEAHANGPDPVLTLRSGLDRISLALFGGKGSAYPTPARYLRGPAASTLGAAPKAAAEAVVAGKKRVVYEHGYPVTLGDPHMPSGGGRPSLATERFVILPVAGGRFVVAAHAYESPIPSAERSGEKAFLALLETLEPAPAGKKRP